MRKILFTCVILLLLTSCKSYKFELGVQEDTKTLTSKVEYTSIEVKFASWGRHCRATLRTRDFDRISKKAVIKNQDTISMIMQELSNLDYSNNNCLCIEDVSAQFTVYYTNYLTIQFDDTTTIDTLELYDEFYFTHKGHPVDMIWQEFKRSDKLIELLQLPPYPSDK